MQNTKCQFPVPVPIVQNASLLLRLIRGSIVGTEQNFQNLKRNTQLAIQAIFKVGFGSGVHPGAPDNKPRQQKGGSIYPLLIVIHFFNATVTFLLSPLSLNPEA